MQDRQNIRKDEGRSPYVQLPDQFVQNPKTRANENVRPENDEAKKQNTENTFGVGTEITDGEDA